MPGPFDDTVFSSPSSESPLSHVKSVVKTSKGDVNANLDNFDASKQDPPVDQRDSVPETIETGKLGWKVITKAILHKLLEYIASFPVGIW